MDRNQKAQRCFERAAALRNLAAGYQNSPMLRQYLLGKADKFSVAGRLYEEGYTLTATRQEALAERS